MYGIFTNIYPKNHPNVGKYTIHGSYGYKCTTMLYISSLINILRGEQPEYNQEISQPNDIVEIGVS